jgi:hypothetical protein
LHKSLLNFSNYLDSAKKNKLKPSKGLKYKVILLTYFLNFWKKFVFPNYIFVFKKYKNAVFFTGVSGKLPSESFLKLKINSLNDF